jgi:hypothetical protein
MSLLREIQDAATNETISLAVVLRKCKILATRLKHEPFKKWVEQELNGYDSREDLPEYRIIHGVGSFGHFAGPFGSGLQNAPIPPRCIPEEFREWIEKIEMFEGVSTYEDYTREEAVRIQWPPDLTALVGLRIYQNMNCLQAWKLLPRGTVVGLLDTIRNRVLSFALEIEEIAPDAGDVAPGVRPLSEQRVSQVFNSYILGGNNTIAAGSSHFTQISTFEVRKNDFESLKNYLTSAGLTHEDVSELALAIKEDALPTGAMKPGKRVSGWIGKMVSKAASGTWDIATSAAADILSKAVSSYYGFDS